VVDPAVPAITAWQLRDDAYVEVTTATGEQILSAQQPFAVDVTPAQLIAA
jgi:hypothetical protein